MHGYKNPVRYRKSSNPELWIYFDRVIFFDSLLLKKGPSQSFSTNSFEQKLAYPLTPPVPH